MLFVRQQAFRVTRRSAYLLEGIANDLPKEVLMSTLGGRSDGEFSRATAKLCEQFVGSPCYAPFSRAVAASIVGKLLQRKDLKRPGEKFQFSIECRDESRIGFTKYAHDVYVSPPTIAYTMPRREPQEVTITAGERTYLGCLGLGMGPEEMTAKGICEGLAAEEATALYETLGASRGPAALARAAFLGVVSIDPALLFAPIEWINPTIYSEDITLVV